MFMNSPEITKKEYILKILLESVHSDIELKSQFI